jgi:hypothetical protein
MRRLLALSLALAAACSAPTEPLDRIVLFEVGPAWMPCHTWYYAPTSCLQVREMPGGDWYLLWDAIEIEGFRYQPGRRYIIEVGIYQRREEVLDAPNEIYRLRRYLRVW